MNKYTVFTDGHTLVDYAESHLEKPDGRVHLITNGQVVGMVPLNVVVSIKYNEWPPTEKEESERVSKLVDNIVKK